MAEYIGNKIQDPIKDNPHLSQIKNSSENLDELDIKRKKRSFSEENWLYWIRIAFMIVATIISFAIIIVLFWNILAPEDWRWLQETDIATLKNIATTIIVGLIMSFATAYLFRRK